MYDKKRSSCEEDPPQSTRGLCEPTNIIDVKEQIANNILTNSIKYYKSDYKVNPIINNACLKCEIKFLNVQNISQVKMIQIENNILKSKQHSIFCLVETHENIHKMKTNDDISIRIKTRHQADIPGGGIAVLFNKTQWLINEKVFIEILWLLMFLKARCISFLSYHTCPPIT